MSADIEKLAVFDSRIVQSRPKYAVEKGALSLTNAPFNAIAATASQMTYNIYVPSENVYVDRGMEWSSQVLMTFSSTYPTLPAGGVRIVSYGLDWALCAYPLNSLCSTTSATINDTTAVINTNDVLKEVLRLTDYKMNRLQRTGPTMLDKYQNYNDGVFANNNVIGGFQTSTESAEMPNGAWSDLVYWNPTTSTPLSGTTYLTSTTSTPAYTGAAFCSLNGLPVAPPTWTNAVYNNTGFLVQYNNSIYISANITSGNPPPNATYWTPVSLNSVVSAVPSQNGGASATITGTVVPITFRFGSTEKIVLSPFTFADIHEWDTGLFGINNIQLIMNLQSPTRLVRNLPAASGCYVIPSSVALATVGSVGPFISPRINVQFLTPSLDVPLPPKSVVPYMEFPRYITNTNGLTVAAGATAIIQSQTITLPQIPDLFVIYVKPSNYYPTDADFYFPLATSADGINNPLTVNFDNFSGLLSSQSAQQLYAMSVKNGLDLDYNSWSGMASAGGQIGASTFVSSSNSINGRIPTVGGFLVLKPSQDITLQTGQAPSLVGNFTFQFNLQIKNTTSVSQTNLQMFVITANSGFFESIRGSSRIIKGVLSEQDIISAPLAPMGTRDMLCRHVGGGGIMKSMANVLSKAKDIYHATKPIHGMVKSAMGMGGGDVEQSGGRRHARKGLEARLM